MSKRESGTWKAAVILGLLCLASFSPEAMSAVRLRPRLGGCDSYIYLSGHSATCSSDLVEMAEDICTARGGGLEPNIEVIDEEMGGSSVEVNEEGEEEIVYDCSATFYCHCPIIIV